MKIDTTKIENFDSMSADEKLEALMAYEFEESKNDSEEVIKLKNALNKASSETASFKKQLREKQTEDERREAERKEREAERETLLQSLIREKDVSNYQAKFLENGYDPELAKSSAEAMANGDFNTIFANQKIFNEQREKSIRADVLKGTPRPQGGNTETSVTKEQFASMGYTERAKLFEENPELYQELNK